MEFYHSLSLKYGPVYTLFLPCPTVVIADYESIKECLVTKGEHFIGKKEKPPFILLTNNTNGGIFASNGPNWYEQRKVSISILRNFGMGKSLMEQQVMRSIHNLVGHLESLEDKDAVMWFKPLQLTVGNVINETLFGFINHYNKCDKFFDFVETITLLFANFTSLMMNFYGTWPILTKVPLINAQYSQLSKRMAKYYEFVIAQVDVIRRDFIPNSDVSTFVQAYLQEMESSPNNSYLNMTQLYCLASDFWIAGMETTSTTLRWAMLYLVKYPEVQKKAHEEIDRVVGRDRYPTMADKAMMPYVSALILEIQRYANVPQVNKLLAFGMGKRQCAAEGLAKMELFLILTTVLQKYNLYATSNDVDIRPNFSLVVKPTDHPTRIVARS
uniref:Cytochrome P450 n=1 Tax=Ditylenchus dipsaci TaxID=166011 RepID=A0A915CY12_9BILA